MTQFEQAVSRKQRIVEAASGREKAALVLKNATYVNVFSNRLCRGDIAVAEGIIVGMGEYSGERECDMSGKLVLPGLIDAHIHLESAMVAPKEFAKAVLPHGTTTVITDPHEIANVMGAGGIEYMLQATEGLPVDVRVMLPSCVPATPMDESGAVLEYSDIEGFYSHPRVRGLAEMMNFPGVIAADGHVLEKLVSAQANHKKIDGHAPGLTGYDLNAYIAAGVYSDHECSDLSDALRKLELGQFIMVREGTAAHNLQALLPLLTRQYADRCMFCCDDKHPGDLLRKGHIDYHIREAIRQGADPIVAVKVACHNAARYFQLNDRGAIAPGYLADFVIVDNFQDFNILQVFKQGKELYNGQCVADFPAPDIAPELTDRARDTFRLSNLRPEDFAAQGPRGVIGMVPGEIVTVDRGQTDGVDISRDILKIAVVERHKNTGHIGIGYLQGYGLKRGAVATSVAHDSHNLIVVGTNDADMAAAANRVAQDRGGIVVLEEGAVRGEVVLAIAGLMSEGTLEDVDRALEQAKDAAFALGVNRDIDPFMTLSFMSLPVIPALRLTTRGVLDVAAQRYV